MDTAEPIAQDLRPQRGLAIVQAKGAGIRHIVGKTYLVPSQTNDSGGYVVNVEDEACTCPDFEERKQRCKHLWAVLIFRREVALPDGSVSVTEHRITYRQDWAAYNRAQCEEKERVALLLRGLCDGIAAPPSKPLGRPRIPLGDVVYSATMKVYTTFSGRRADSDITACKQRGLLDQAPAYNTVFRYVEQPSMQPLLTTLVEEAATPLRAIEQDFIADATGFATNTYSRWFDHKYGKEKKKQRWVKAHAMTGAITNVITSIRVTEGNEHDAPVFTSLLKATAAQGYPMREVSADKAYLSNENLAAIEAVGAVPYIPFKSNSSPTGGSEAWRRLWHLFSLHREEFLAHYHKRSNVESTFSALKRKFGGALRSKLPAAQHNEVLLKCLCYNLSVLVHTIHEFKIEPKFWQPREQVSA